MKTIKILSLALTSATLFLSCKMKTAYPMELEVITLTESATTKVDELIKDEGEDNLALRVAVRPGGCSGFSYEMYFDWSNSISKLDTKKILEGIPNRLKYLDKQNFNTYPLQCNY